MAVRVMVAPAIVKGELEKPAKAVRRRKEGEPPKPKRRRSSVYDAEGNEVFITLMCLKCHKMRPLSQFGLRKMADGAIRNQPWCRSCRSGTSAKAEKGSAESVEPTVLEGAPPEPAQPVPPEPKRAGGAVAAEVAAALAAGRG